MGLSALAARGHPLKFEMSPFFGQFAAQSPPPSREGGESQADEPNQLPLGDHTVGPKLPGLAAARRVPGADSRRGDSGPPMAQFSLRSCATPSGLGSSSLMTHLERAEGFGWGGGQGQT